MIDGKTIKRLEDWGYELKEENDLLEIRRIADDKLVIMMYYELDTMYVVANGEYLNPRQVKDLYPSENGITVDAIYGDINLPVSRLIKIEPLAA